MTYPEMTEMISPQLSDKDRLILHVGIPRLASHLDQLAQWLDHVEAHPHAPAAMEMARLSGTECLAVILKYQPEERDALLHQADIPEPAISVLKMMLNRFGLTTDPESPASVVSRMFPSTAEDLITDGENLTLLSIQERSIEPSMIDGKNVTQPSEATPHDVIAASASELAEWIDVLRESIPGSEEQKQWFAQVFLEGTYPNLEGMCQAMAEKMGLNSKQALILWTKAQRRLLDHLKATLADHTDLEVGTFQGGLGKSSSISPQGRTEDPRN